MIDFLNGWNWVITFVLNAILTVVIYRFTVKISFQNKFEHRAKIIYEADKLLDEIYHKESRGSKVTLVDISKIKKMPQSGYYNTEIEGLGYKGVEFFWGTEEVYDNNGSNSLKKSGMLKFQSLVFGVIPYENVENIELTVFGDEYENHAKIYCKFKWRLNKEFFNIFRKNYQMLKVHKNYLKFDCWKLAFSEKLIVKSPFTSFKYYVENKDYNKQTHHYTVKFDELVFD